MNYSDVDVDEAEVAPVDAENEIVEQIHGGRLPDPVSRMAKLDEGLKDITVRFLHLDPPLQITNSSRRERRTTCGFR
ncbi:hypothetical protein Hdeb2414_s0002g00062701 [Helianthus debilis subsp. tardiflorus]